MARTQKQYERTYSQNQHVSSLITSLIKKPSFEGSNKNEKKTKIIKEDHIFVRYRGGRLGCSVAHNVSIPTIEQGTYGDIFKIEKIEGVPESRREEQPSSQSENSEFTED